jgi:hypothetical protein
MQKTDSSWVVALFIAAMFAFILLPLGYDGLCKEEEIPRIGVCVRTWISSIGPVTISIAAICISYYWSKKTFKLNSLKYRQDQLDKIHRQIILTERIVDILCAANDLPDDGRVEVDCLGNNHDLKKVKIDFQRLISALSDVLSEMGNESLAVVNDVFDKSVNLTKIVNQLNDAMDLYSMFIEMNIHGMKCGDCIDYSFLKKIRDELMFECYQYDKWLKSKERDIVSAMDID